MTHLILILLSLSTLALTGCANMDTARDDDDASQTRSSSQVDSLPAPDDVAEAPDDASFTDSGLASRVLVEGSGATHPGPKSVVRVHYTGWTTDGEMFDSSVARQETISFPLNKVIKGWQEGVQLMVEGESRRFWIPAELAYGDNPTRAGAPAGILVFDVELIAIETP